MNEIDIIKNLAQHLEFSKYPYQIPNAFIYKWECDYWVMDQKGITREFEIKISRADYFKDAEKEKHTKACGANYFYYVCPTGLIQPSEVDKRYGLIWINQHGAVEFKKRPVKLHDNLFDDWRMLANKMFWRFQSLWKQKYLDKEITRDQYHTGLLLEEIEQTGDGTHPNQVGPWT